MPSRRHVYQAILSQPVDPTLFGVRRRGHHSEGNDPRASSSTCNPPVVLTTSQLERIQKRSMIQTDAELQEERGCSNYHRQEKKTATTIERRAKMLALAALAEEQNHADNEDDDAKSAAIACLARACKRRNEELDMCKYLSGLAAQAEVRGWWLTEDCESEWRSKGKNGFGWPSVTESLHASQFI